jgi:hypothetical protein
MTDWSIMVCPKCHARGVDSIAPQACPRGCMRELTAQEVIEHGGQPGEFRLIRCIQIDVVPTPLSSVALVNAMTNYPIA